MNHYTKVMKKIWELVQLDLNLLREQVEEKEIQIYITVATSQGYGVKMSEWLRQRYPDKMTIVLQHRFENLVVGDNGFSVVLYFDNKPEEITVPADAIMNFFNTVSGLVITLGTEGELFEARQAKAVTSATAEKPKKEKNKRRDSKKKRSFDDNSDIYIKFTDKG